MDRFAQHPFGDAREAGRAHLGVVDTGIEQHAPEFPKQPEGFVG